MPYARPTLAQLFDRIGASWRTRFPGADVNLRQSPDRAVVAVIAGSTDEDLAYLDWQKDQLFPFSADADYLERWATAKGLARKPASAAAGTILLTGTPAETAPAGAQLQTDSGVVVVLAADATLGVGGTVEVAAGVLAGGAGGNLGIGTRLTFVGTPAGFADTATVASDFAGGGDAESDASLRLRTLRKLAQPSFGGNRNDWEQAALAVPGVTRVFSLAATPTPGAVTLFPLFDDLRANGLPLGVDAWFRPGTGPGAGTGGAGDQRLVLDAVLATRPICAHLYVTALVAAPIAITIQGLANDSAAVRAAIEAELRRMLVRRAGPGKTILRAWIGEAVSRAAGEDGHTLTAPVGNTAVAAGHLATVGLVTYV
jgi:uncharacterized phage protein gp47/JayE